jgi:hypothetical protein
MSVTFLDTVGPCVFLGKMKAQELALSTMAAAR